MSQQFEMKSVRGGDAVAQYELNKFLRAHRILKVDRVFESGAWNFCIEWQLGPVPDRVSARGREKIDYKEALDEATFSIFADLRELRKELSQRERVPAYAVFTNEQLAAIATARCKDA